MKKTIIFSSLLAVFLVAMLPAISAEESNIVKSSRTSPYLLNVQEAYMEVMRTKYANDPNPAPIFLTLAILLLKLLRGGLLLIYGLVLVIILRLISGPSNNTSLAC